MENQNESNIHLEPSWSYNSCALLPRMIATIKNISSWDGRVLVKSCKSMGATLSWTCDMLVLLRTHCPKVVPSNLKSTYDIHQIASDLVDRSQVGWSLFLHGIQQAEMRDLVTPPTRSNAFCKEHTKLERRRKKASFMIAKKMEVLGVSVAKDA